MLFSSQPVTLAILTDLHYGAAGPIAQRRSEIADILFRRVVHRLNRLIKPDVTLVLGDLLDDGDSPEAAQRLGELRTTLDKLASPYLVIPGNHDGDVAAFYRVFDRPADITDIGGVRFLPFIDPEAPGYNATRSAAAIERFRQARAGYCGPIVALQHVCLVPPEGTEVPYNYTNASEIIAAMADTGIELSISGHHHAGSPPVRNATTRFVTAPALCESPFSFLIVTLDGDDVTVTRHQLAMDKSLGLIDRHVHTQLAYCSDNMRVDRAIGLARDFGLAGIGFAEHSGQLYFPAERYWGGRFYEVGVAGAREADDRMAAYLDLRQRYQAEDVRFGLEVDIDFSGRLGLKPGDRERVDYLLGSVHRSPSSPLPHPDIERMADEFMFLTSRLVSSGIDILAHPFRLFRRAGLMPPERLFLPVAELLLANGVAAEINFHTNQPPLAFVRMCLDRNIKFSFGGDAHNLYEVGEFADHVQLLADAGFDGSLSDVLIPPTSA